MYIASSGASARRLPWLGIRLLGLLTLAMGLGVAMVWNVTTKGLGAASVERVQSSATNVSRTVASAGHGLQIYARQISHQFDNTSSSKEISQALQADTKSAPAGDLIGHVSANGAVEAYIADSGQITAADWLLRGDAAHTPSTRLTADNAGNPWLVGSAVTSQKGFVVVAAPASPILREFGVLVRQNRVVASGSTTGLDVKGGDPLPTGLAGAISHTGTAVTATVDGVAMSAQAVNLGSGFAIVTASPIGTPSGLLTPIIFFGSSILVVFLVALSLVDKELSRPLHRLQRAVETMADGKLDQHVPHGPHNEVGFLAEDLEAARIQLRDVLRQTEAQAFVAAQLNEATSLDDTLQTIAAFVNAACGGDAAVIVATSDGDDFDLRIIAGSRQLDPLTIKVLLCDNDAVRESRGEAVIVTPARDATPAGAGMQQWCAAPIDTEGRTAGVFAVGADYHVFTNAERTIVAGAAEQVSDALLRQELVRSETARRAADEASRAKSDYLSRMSHELRTPLTSIIGYADLLSLKLTTGDESEWLQAIATSSDHLVTLIDDLLDIARIEAGRETFSVGPVDVTSLLLECIAVVAPAARARNTTIDLQDPAPNVSMLADRHRLRQVVLNLLTNAVKYAGPNAGVWLSVSPSTRGTGRIIVHDNGPGIPEARQQSLFQPFERLGAERTSVRGTGIGLALSRRLVEGMGGQIGCTSTPGSGSSFWVELPFADSVSEETMSLSATAVSPSEARRKTVLSIEDNPVNQQVITSVLARRPELRLITAMDGHNGIDIARENAPDLILLDLHLPDIDGEEVLRTLKSDSSTAQVPIVILTADATEQRMRRVIAAGATAYLTKPFRVRHFLEMLDTELADPEGSVRSEAAPRQHA